MGATVTVGKRVAAYRDAAGQPIYILSENTYEKNVYPHTPRWNVIGFGRLDAMLDRIFVYASYACGGLLQGRGGAIDPTTYVAGWLREMAAPHAFEKQETHLTLQENGMHGVLHTEDAQETQETLVALRQAGYPAIAEELASGRRVTFSFKMDAGALAAIATTCPAWRFVTVQQGDAPVVADLAHHPKKSASPPPETPFPYVYQLGGPGGHPWLDQVVSRTSQGLHIEEGGYNLLQHFVASYGPTERAYPGHFREAYKDFKARLEALPLLPNETILRVDPARAEGSWRHAADQLAARIGHAGRPWGEIRDMAVQEYHFQYFLEAVCLEDAAPLDAPAPDLEEYPENSHSPSP